MSHFTDIYIFIYTFIIIIIFTFLWYVLDAAEELAKAELKQKAQRELEDWYKQHEEQVAKTRQANRLVLFNVCLRSQLWKTFLYASFGNRTLSFHPLLIWLNLVLLHVIVNIIIIGSCIISLQDIGLSQVLLLTVVLDF